MVAAVQSPATQALLAQHTICKPKETTRQHPSNVDSKLSRDFFTLNFNDDSTNSVNAFPVIEWDNSEESDSDSIRSIDSWKTVLTDWSDSSSERTLGKRGRMVVVLRRDSEREKREFRETERKLNGERQRERGRK